MNASLNDVAAGKHCPIPALLLALLLCGCSTFNRDWNSVAHTTISQDSIEGRWEGHWLSAANGHSGRLRCLVTQDGEAYQARFHAHYMKILRFGYTVPLTAMRSNDVWHFRGEADLGKLAGGVYRYEGRATTTHFHTTYNSKYDHGDFKMARPVAD